MGRLACAGTPAGSGSTWAAPACSLRLWPRPGRSLCSGLPGTLWYSCAAAAPAGAARRSMPSPRRCSPASSCWMPASSQRLGSAAFGGGGCMSRLARQSGQVKLPERLCCSQATRQEVCMAWEQGSCLPACGARGRKMLASQLVQAHGNGEGHSRSPKLSMPGEKRRVQPCCLRSPAQPFSALPARLHAAQADAAGARLQLCRCGIRERVAQAVLQAAVRCMLCQAATQRPQRVLHIQKEHPIDELQLQAVQPPAGGQGGARWVHSLCGPTAKQTSCAPASLFR